jgi:proteasome lid subunit RPN8/RPN11
LEVGEMTILLEPNLLEQIGKIAGERKPNEACGLLVPLADHTVRVVELPNRSMMPHDSFEMKGADIFLTLQSILGEDLTVDEVERMLPEIAVWHSHPNGGVGPSRADMRNKPAKFKSLVVTLREGEPPLGTWF